MIYKDKNFEHFDDLDIQSYHFETFAGSDDPNEEQREFEIKELSQSSILKRPEKIIKLEEELKRSESTGFKISPIVREHRGHKEFEISKSKASFEAKVDVRVNQLKDQAYKRGYEDGFQQGRVDSIEKLKETSEEKIARLVESISTAISHQQVLLDNQKKEVYRLVRDLTKWFIIRELKEDSTYLERLLEKLVYELGEKSNLIIHINQEQFEDMPEVLEKVQEKIGELNNVRTVINYDLGVNGIRVESENGIILADLKEQFKVFDKLFEGVGVITESEEDDGSDQQS